MYVEIEKMPLHRSDVQVYTTDMLFKLWRDPRLLWRMNIIKLLFHGTLEPLNWTATRTMQ